MIKLPKPRYSVASLLMLTTVVELGISHYKTSHDLSLVRAELTTARNELSYLDVTDSQRIHAVSIPTYGGMQWRWRVQLPVRGRYRIGYSFTQIPESGLPVSILRDDHAFLDSGAKPMPGGQPFILTIAVFKDAKGIWQFSVETPERKTTRPIKNAPAWIDTVSFSGWSTNVGGKRGTISTSDSKPLVLLSYRKGKVVAGGHTVEMEPTEGMMFWIEPIGR